MHRYRSCILPLFAFLWLQASRVNVYAAHPLQDTITISSHIFVVNPTHVVLNGKTVSAGGPPIKVDGETISADPQNDLFVNGVEVITMSGDTNLGIPVVATACTASVCLVSEEDVTATSTAADTGKRTKASSGSKKTSSKTAPKTTHTETTQSGKSTGKVSGGDTSKPDTTDSKKSGDGGRTATKTASTTEALIINTVDGIALTGNPQTAITVDGKTITPGGSAVTVSSHTFAIPASATGAVIRVDGSTTTLKTAAATGGGGSSHSKTITAGPTSTYTIDGVLFTGNPTSLVAGTTTLTPGGSAFTSKGHTFKIPASATSGIIDVDGKTTTLQSPAAQGSGSGTQSGSSDTASGLGVGFGVVGSITLSDASTTVTYDEVVLTKYSTIQTPTIIVTDFPEFNSKGSKTLVHGSIIVGKGGTVLIHPPSPPPGGGLIGPPGFGGPIRPPGGSSGCPSFFGISFCPPSINIEPPGSINIDPADLPEGTDPDNPDDSENNKSDKQESQEQKTKSDDQKTSSDHTKSTASRPSSVSATTTRSLTTKTASRSSSTESCSASGCGCVTLSYAPDSTPNPLDDDSNEMRKRALAGRIIDKRGKDVYYSTTTVSVGQGACGVNKYTIKPSYPGPAAVTNNEGANPTPQMVAFYQTATYWAVPTTPPKCGAPVWGFLDTSGLSDAAKGGSWAIGGNKKSVNIDHVFEVSLLDEFFAAQIKAGFTCADITTLFDVADGSTGGTRLNTVFGQLPSLTNPDFLGMDAALNRLKGSLWNPNIQGSNLDCANSNACVQSLSNLAVVMAIANNDKVKELFSASNGRIYAAFKGVDALIAAQQGCANPLQGANGDPIKATWADAYSTWITDKVKSNNDLITKTASIISASISTDVAAAPANKQGNVRNWSSFVSNWNVAYKTVDSLTFPQPSVWPNNPLGIQKRADATGACSKPAKSASAGSTTKAPSKTSQILASTTSPGFTCTSSQKNVVVSGYPCLCESLTYCTQSTGAPCGWTTVPAAENCCLDCM